ncbi:MAG: histone deacetylase [Steroidobacteraceae bacterium]|nr:histone deacetylase [Gammaproteobacteria bacterium]
MKVSHHPDYYLPLPTGHPFPMAKYTLVYDVLREQGLLPAERIMLPEEIAREHLARVHTADYLERIFGDGLSEAEVRRLGVPWSARLLRRSRLAVSGTVLASEAALAEGLGGNLAGGTHHAFADHGEGFCVLNDVAVAIRKLQHEGRCQRALIIDLDVHQGNGTAKIFENDERVFTFSMHGERNYPAQKMCSSLDVGLPDGTGDERYLESLQQALRYIRQHCAPELVFYLAGVDVMAGDRYGRFTLTEEGLRTRERLVLDFARAEGLPMVITLAGGYARDAAYTARLHAIVFEEALKG